MTALERIARAIVWYTLSRSRYTQDGVVACAGPDEKWESLNEPTRLKALEAARAALTALREPDEEIVSTMADFMCDHAGYDLRQAGLMAWQAAIDAALQEGQ